MHGAFKTKQVKLPAQLFEDFTPDGSLAKIFLRFYEHKVAAGWDTFDITKRECYGQFVEMLVNIEADLKESGLLSSPKCYISNDLDPTAAATVARILMAKGADIVGEQQHASYTIGPDPPATTRLSTSSDNFMREVVHEYAVDMEPMCRLHWLFYPDSCACACKPLASQGDKCYIVSRR